MGFWSKFSLGTFLSRRPPPQKEKSVAELADDVAVNEQPPAMDLDNSDPTRVSGVMTVLRQAAPTTRVAFDGLGKGLVTPQVVRFYNEFDKLTAQSSGKISCKSGCTYCCHYRVMVTATEVFGIVEAIRKLPLPVRVMLTERIHDTASRTSQMTRDVYQKTNVECAMLIDGKCSVYSARPIACRGHHSKNVAACKETYHDVHSTALSLKDNERQVIFYAFDRAQTAANRQAGVDTSKYELHAALAVGLSNSTAFKRWKAGKSAFPGVVDKETLTD